MLTGLAGQLIVGFRPAVERTHVGLAFNSDCPIFANREPVNHARIGMDAHNDAGAQYFLIGGLFHGE